MSKLEDEADLLKKRALPADPKSNVRPIALQAPRVLTVRDLLVSSCERLSTKDTRVRYCTTGCYELDRITGGFRPGFTWLFGATTSWGKSSWLVAVADENLRRGKKVLIVSSEDTDEVYGDRLMVRRARVDAVRFRSGKLDDEELRRVHDVTARAESLPVYIDARRFPVEDLAGHVGRAIKEHAIDLVAFDYVQEFRTKRRFQDERIKMREVASVLRHVIKDAKISGIIFSQLTTDERTKVPTRLNIRDCRDMAHAAEVIVLGFEPDQDITSDGRVIAEKGKKCLYVDKVKNGPRNRIVALDWDPDTASFRAQKGPEDEWYDTVIGDQADEFFEDVPSYGHAGGNW